MKYQSVMKKELCLGRLIWIQPPSFGSAVFFAKKWMNGIGVADREMIYLSARQFIRYSQNGFSREFLKNTRILLIGELVGLDIQTKSQLLGRLSHHRMYKQRFDLNLVLVSPFFANLDDFVREKLKIEVFPVFDEYHPIGINERIHEYIETASLKCKKPIWRLSPEAAECLESTLLRDGEEYLKQLIFRAVLYSENKKLQRKDLDLAQQSLSETSTKQDTI